MQQSKIDNVLYESTYSAVISILVVGGLITIFYLLTEMLLSYGVLNPIINFFNLFIGDRAVAKGFTLGLIEYTRGLKQLASSGIDARGLSISAFLLGFSGLSIIAQSVAYLKKAKIKTAAFFLGKILSAVLGLFYGFILGAIAF